jgi:hypothetical protein
VTIRNCTFANNTAGDINFVSSDGGEGGQGGWALAGAPGSGGNAGKGGAGPSAAGGAIFCAGGTVSVIQTTLSANTATGSGGADGGDARGTGSTGSAPPSIPPAADSGAGGDAQGGAIEITEGAFTISSSTLFDNIARGGLGGQGIGGATGGFSIGPTITGGTGGQGGTGGAGGNARGGAIDLSGGTLQVVNTTFATSQSGNQAVGGAGGPGGQGGTGGGGGPVSNGANGGNGGNGGPGGTGLGGAINVAGGTLTISSCTLSGNSASAGAGGAGGAAGAGGTGFTSNGNPGTPGGAAAAGIGLGGGAQVSAGAVLQLFNALLAGDTASGDPDHGITSADVAGLFTSQGHNLIGDGSGGSGFKSSLGDQVGTAASPINALLGPLQNNGGPTWTLAPQPGSPAVNAPNLPKSPAAPKLDQRGVPRDTAPDIGASEVSTVAGVPTLTAPGLQSAFSGSSFSFALGSFTDAGTAGPWKVTVSWGDNSSTAFSVAAAGNLPAKAHAYKAPGFYTVTETLTNAQGAVATQTFLAEVGGLVVTPSATSMTAGTSIGLTVTVRDAAGFPVAGFTGKLHFTSTDAKAAFHDAATGAVLASNNYTFVVGDHGTHSFTVELVKAGKQTITVKGTTAGSPAGTAAVTVNPAAPAVMLVFAGSGQTAAINTLFGTVLQAKVTDAFGNVVSGVAVTFTAPATGPSGTFAGGSTTVTVTTNSKGVAVAPPFTPNGLKGQYTVKATVSGLAGEADFTLTND